MINKAEHSYSGKKDLVITDKDKIKNIESLLKKLKTDVSDKTSAQMNFGFVEVLYSTNECENIEYFNVVFTENYGDLIHYNSDKDYDYEYFSNQEIVEYIKMEMGMSENKKYE